MIDLKAARQDSDRFRTALARRGASDDFDALLEADRSWRDLTERVESLRAEQKRSSKQAPTPEEIDQLKRLKKDVADAQEALEGADRRRQELLDRIPNLPDPTAADGMDEEDAETVRSWGKIPDFGFNPKDHLQLGSQAGWVDMARGAKISGSRFAYRIGDVALAEMALYRFVLDRLVSKGFLPVLPPVLVKAEALYGTGYLPAGEEDLYRLERDDMYLTGTSEVGLGGIHTAEILTDDQLPAKYTAFSTNFRREAGAAGKDTRGMFRVHQFDKVEMFVYCLPDQSAQIHEQLLAHEEQIVQELGLPYRVMNISVGDLGAPAAKKYDIEAWFPTQQRYREITSCSNTTDYQARRLKVRYRTEGGTQFVHTLNGTGITARSLLAIMENFQDQDGVVAVPEVLQQFGAPKTLGGG